VPFDSNLSSFDFQLVGEEEKLDVEGETVDVHDFEEEFCCVSGEELETALSVLCFDA
jgi:hypothetical protein